MSVYERENVIMETALVENMDSQFFKELYFPIRIVQIKVGIILYNLLTSGH